ncbi:unnamed protein product [Penicillium salamii]|nr:unnamed protein product [Penicillium salamii]
MTVFAAHLFGYMHGQTTMDAIFGKRKHRVRVKLKPRRRLPTPKPHPASPCTSVTKWNTYPSI